MDLGLFVHAQNTTGPHHAEALPALCCLGE